MSERGGLFGGERVVEVDDTSLALAEGGTVTRRALSPALHERLSEATRRIMDAEVPIDHRGVEVVDGTVMRIELEVEDRRCAIRMGGADEPSEPVWQLLELLDTAWAEAGGPDGP